MKVENHTEDGRYHVYLRVETHETIVVKAETHEISGPWIFFLQDGRQVAGFQIQDVVGFERDPLIVAQGDT